MPRPPTEDELTEADAANEAFVERRAAVPGPRRRVLTSKKFAGPVGQGAQHTDSTTEEP